MNWDDLKIFLAVARRKKLSEAANHLKLDVTTISRRIKRLEDNLGQTLFERLRSGHVLTLHGETLLAKAEAIELQTDSMTIVKGQDAGKPSGVLRVSVSEGFGSYVLAPILHEFTQNYPDIEIDLVSGTGFLSLSKREADIAIGLSKPNSQHITSRVLSPYALHLYGSKAYLQAHKPITELQDLSRHKLIGYIDDLAYSDQLRYFYDALPNLRPTIRSTSILAQKALVQSGAGLGILPDFLTDDSFIALLPNAVQVKRQFWFSAHQSVASMGKVKAFQKFAMDRLKATLVQR